ncbi:MAG: HIT domain-containing protein [Candidatus Micrarchaeota archaeon]|nr:HIT domain-containing protein [Candidatus Micrarchaeota archaeon]
MSRCALCDELQKGKHVAYIGKHSFILVNLRLLKPGHVLVLPKRHLEAFDELTEEEAKEIFDVVEKCSHAINKVYSHYPIIVVNPKTKRSESHIHIHLVPTDYGARDYIAKIENLPYNEEAPSEIREIVREEIAKAMEEG